ncbi:hypothetical protein M404DRAFT_28898 [Pisolithus tinctorius Marx 270]|uniref:Uncharacterized protein n=1 Tax=Pisolithus tinctorius Marx 270 TaxID=870435 RepID=A0A0C3JUN4_PISTI|nr:hypothetical protein M404DRAFT_28898 [Pisolithus tinctorius Marx 270]
MRFKMLFAQDRNDSLKRVATRVLDGNLDDASPLTPSHPMLEGAFHHEQYLTRDFVEKFASGRQTGHSIVAEDGDGNLCAERWKNMKDSATQKMWSVFDETGVFIAVCRHGFCLLIADMVQSGEQSKYALAVTSKPLDTFGSDLGGGYDIGCRFKTTLASSVLGEHNLTTYVEGLGLEDLEGCERAFSKSNALAPSTRYTSIFHRRQAIACYFEHNDELEVYANLTKFLLNNYKQALNLLSNGRLTLERLMCELGVSDPDTFKLWLDEEREYLGSLLREPVEETLQMEYWQRLVNLAGSRDTRKDISTCPWASPTARLTINMYFKLCRAKEEVVRLNVEIRRVVTYLIDEDRYLRACEALYQDTNPALAYQISRYRAIRSRFTPLHLRTLEKISHLPGFRGTLTPGISVSCGPGDSAHVPQRVPIQSVLSSPPICTDDGEEEADEDLDDDHGDDLEEQCEALQHILSVTTDT